MTVPRFRCTPVSDNNRKVTRTNLEMAVNNLLNRSALTSRTMQTRGCRKYVIKVYDSELELGTYRAKWTTEDVLVFTTTKPAGILSIADLCTAFC